jgi:hypothetical protein
VPVAYAVKFIEDRNQNQSLGELREGPPHMVRGYSLGEMINRGFVELDLVRVEPHAGRVSLMIMSWNNLRQSDE